MAGKGLQNVFKTLTNMSPLGLFMESLNPVQQGLDEIQKRLDIFKQKGIKEITPQILSSLTEVVKDLPDSFESQITPEMIAGMIASTLGQTVSLNTIAASLAGPLQDVSDELVMNKNTVIDLTTWQGSLAAKYPTLAQNTVDLSTSTASLDDQIQAYVTKVQDSIGQLDQVNKSQTTVVKTLDDYINMVNANGGKQ